MHAPLLSTVCARSEWTTVQQSFSHHEVHLYMVGEGRGLRPLLTAESIFQADAEMEAARIEVG